MIELIAFGTLNIAGKNVLVNISGDSQKTCFGDMTSETVEMHKQNNLGEWIEIDKRYFNNVTEFFTVN